MKNTELAEKVGIARTTISRMGKNEIVSHEVTAKICLELDCDVVDVLSILHSEL